MKKIESRGDVMKVNIKGRSDLKLVSVEGKWKVKGNVKHGLYRG